MTPADYISSREYLNGDANAINDLYYRVTGRSRSVREFEWQWLAAPAGQGSIHLIHTEADQDQQPLLIGHHGIMPLRFSNGTNAAVVGKTENTMVDSLYRSKIIYPRYESRFKAQYSGKYDALFSTMGPTAAIRQRRAQGYIEVGTWERFVLSARKACLNAGMEFFSGSRKLLDLAPLTEEILEKYDFTAFWDSCKSKYPFTPSREKCDLKWRFVQNPYRSYLIALLKDSSLPSGIAGFAIICLPSKDRKIFTIEDIVVLEPSSYAFQSLLGKVMRALFFKRGITHALLPFVLDGSAQSKFLFEGASSYSSRLNQLRIFLKRISRKQKPVNKTPGMMRWINPDSRHSICTDQWFITGMVFEGR